jgi:hypothetical protein
MGLVPTPLSDQQMSMFEPTPWSFSALKGFRKFQGTQRNFLPILQKPINVGATQNTPNNVSSKTTPKYANFVLQIKTYLSCMSPATGCISVAFEGSTALTAIEELIHVQWRACPVSGLSMILRNLCSQLQTTDSFHLRTHN